MSQLLNNFAKSASMRGENLLAGRTGTTATSVLAFNTVTRNITGVTAAEFFAVTTAAAGTLCTLALAGVYHVLLGTTVPASGDLEIGIGVDAVQPVTADPDLALAGVEATARITAPAATSIGGSLVHVVTVTPAQAAAGGVVVSLLASDGSAAAPAAGDITAAQTYFQIDLVSNLAAA